MKNLLSGLLLLSIISMSCSKDMDSTLDNNLDTKTLDLFGVSVEQKDGMLQFSDEGSLQKVLTDLTAAQSVMTKMGDNGVILETDYTLENKGFHSMYDDYVASADEAYLYYDKWEDYSTYKAKYSNLFFPEQGDDYSAYLPISDQSLAKLANPEGFILVGEKMIDCKDIKSYADLEKNGLSIPNEKRRDVGDVIHHREGDNLVWVKIANQGYNGTKRLFQFSVCFRDKGFLGIWHNRRASSRLTVQAVVGQYSHSDVAAHEKMSPHTSSFAFSVPNGGVTLNLILRYGPLGSKDLKGSRSFPAA